MTLDTATLDTATQSILTIVGIHTLELNGLLIPRDPFLSDEKYDEAKQYIPALKRSYSSSFMTSLQANAEKCQRWPLLNLVRQILHVYGYKMEPVRAADGYTLDGVKKYKRLFRIVLASSSSSSSGITKKIEIDTA
jgi:hypothetical protein